MNEETNEFLTKDDLIDYNVFVKITENENIHSKSEFAKNISMFGDKYINETINKKKLNEKTKQKFIKWILKNSTSYTYEELNECTFQDVRNIKNEISTDLKSPIKKIINFLLNGE